VDIGPQNGPFYGNLRPDTGESATPGAEITPAEVKKAPGTRGGCGGYEQIPTQKRKI